MSERLRRRDLVALSMGVVATVVTLWRLFVPSAIGLADNGDNNRMTCHLRAWPTGHVWFHNVTFIYARGGSWRYCTYHSSAEVPLWIASKVSSRLPTPHYLDLRVLAVLYALAFGAGVGALVWSLPGWWWSRVAAGVAVIAFIDVAFVSYFASGMSEPIGLVAFIWCVALLLRLWRDPRFPIPTMAATIVAGVALVTAKPQYVLMTAPLAVGLLVRPITNRKLSGRWKGRIPGAIAAVIVVFAGVWCIHVTPQWATRDDQYHAVFAELLPHSPNPRADLRELGLPTELVRLSNQSYYDPGAGWRTDMNMLQVWKKITPLRMTRFYVNHPARAWGFAERGFESAATVRPSYLGNYPITSGKAPDAHACRFCPTVAVGHAIGQSSRWLLPTLWWIALALAVEALVRGDRARRTIGGALLFTLVATALLFATALIGEGSWELTKHLYLADAAGVLSGALVVADIVELVTPSLRKARRRSQQRQRFERGEIATYPPPSREPVMQP